ncbi:MAG: ABC transporter permease, partial [Bacteroidales bacterium]|nr:ABC transporter permease [Bacteroidales bacterium]
MNLPLFIARRYILSRKSHQVINIISWISLAGITVGTMALIVVLSVFNGFEHLVIGLMNTFDADLEITAEKGKTFDPALLPGADIRKEPGVLSFAEVVEENALMRYRNHQHIVTLKGVDEEYVRTSPLDSMLLDGEFVLNDGTTDYMVVGAGVAWFLEMNIQDRMSPAEIFVPRRGKVSTVNPLDAFNRELVFPSGVFSVQQEFDTRYALVPLQLIRRLLEYDNEVSSIEIRLSKDADA